MASARANQKKAEEFADRFFGYLNAASLVQLASVGQETRLFDVMAGLEPSTSVQIARAGGLNERYVREWLNGLVAGRVVIYNPRSRKYSLPPEHAACLTRAAGPRNLASFAQVPPASNGRSSAVSRTAAASLTPRTPGSRNSWRTGLASDSKRC